TWVLSPWTITEVPDRMNPAGQFLNFGRNYAGAKDKYVYEYTSIPNQPDATYLIRVLPASLQKDPRTPGIYQYYAGVGPAWSNDISKARPVFVDPNRRQITHVSYDPGLHRYIASAQGYGVGELGLFDAPEPWG